MPDLPISGLPQAILPLDGTEQLVLVQGGVTKQITAEDQNYIDYTLSSYLVPINLTCQDGVDIALNGLDVTAIFRLSWTGSSGNMQLILPDATAPLNVNRSIRFISDDTYATNTRSYLTPQLGQTIDGSSSYYEINKSWEGIMVWSDGSEWFIIQKKA
jgi:hypothetical protein